MNNSGVSRTILRIFRPPVIALSDRPAQSPGIRWSYREYRE